MTVNDGFVIQIKLASLGNIKDMSEFQRAWRTNTKIVCEAVIKYVTDTLLNLF